MLMSSRSLPFATVICSVRTVAVQHGIISLSARLARTPQEMAQSLLGRLDAPMQAKDLIRPGIMGTEARSERTTVGGVVRTVLRPYEDDACRATGRQGGI